MDIKKNKKIILYDQDCGFCNTCKDFSLKRNKNLIFFGIQSKEGEEIFQKNNLKKTLETIFYFTENKIYQKSEAVANIFKTFFWPWKIIYFLWKIFPKKFSNFLYDFVAKHKNKFSKNKTCKIK